jgi:hypothetical protein
MKELTKALYKKLQIDFGEPIRTDEFMQLLDYVCMEEPQMKANFTWQNTYTTGKTPTEKVWSRRLKESNETGNIGTGQYSYVSLEFTLVLNNVNERTGAKSYDKMQLKPHEGQDVHKLSGNHLTLAADLQKRVNKFFNKVREDLC